MSTTPTKKNTKKDASKKAGTKRKPKENEQGWRNVLVWIVPLAIGFVLTVVSVIWASHKRLAIIAAVGAVISFLGYFLFLAEWYVWIDRKQRIRMRWFFGALSVGVVIVGGVWVYGLWNQTPRPFLARIPTAPLGSYKADPRGGVFWATYNRGTGDVVTPAQLGLFVEIINQQSREALIDSYTIEAQNDSGKWFKLIRVDATSSPVFLCFEGGDLHKAKPLDLVNGLDRELKDKAIPAYSTVRGWAFFELPQDIRESSPFRITVEDNTGVIAQSTDDQYSPIKDYVQSGDLHLAAGLKDLTGYRFMMYSELFKERVPN